MKNVFQLWLENDKELPFIVMRHSWGNVFFDVVKITDIKEYNNGRIYGKAYGYYYNKEGKKIKRSESIYPKKYVNEYLSELNCAGCYQWTKISNRDIIKE